MSAIPEGKSWLRAWFVLAALCYRVIHLTSHLLFICSSEASILHKDQVTFSPYRLIFFGKYLGPIRLLYPNINLSYSSFLNYATNKTTVWSLLPKTTFEKNYFIGKAPFIEENWKDLHISTQSDTHLLSVTTYV